MKNLHLDLVRVTEAGAISASYWVGRGDKLSADKAATEAMRQRLNQIEFSGEIALGEGIKDGSYGLYEGEKLGSKEGNIEYSIAVDPIEGTTPTIKGGYEAISVIALGGKNAFFKTNCFYMNKLVVGKKIADYTDDINIKDPIEKIIYNISYKINKPIKHITVCMLDRPRHKETIEKLRALECRIKLISDCDVSACVAACMEDDIDMYYGIGGSPEAVITAAAVKCLEGLILTQLADANGKILDDHVFTAEELAKGDVIFSATGITNGMLLKGIRFGQKGPITQSITMRSESKTIRKIETIHGN
jgi:fructose-1,6-bisphosphatase II